MLTGAGPCARPWVPGERTLCEQCAPVDTCQSGRPHYSKNLVLFQMSTPTCAFRTRGARTGLLTAGRVVLGAWCSDASSSDAWCSDASMSDAFIWDTWLGRVHVGTRFARTRDARKRDARTRGARTRHRTRGGRTGQTMVRTQESNCSGPGNQCLRPRKQMVWEVGNQW